MHACILSFVVCVSFLRACMQLLNWGLGVFLSLWMILAAWLVVPFTYQLSFLSPLSSSPSSMNVGREKEEEKKSTSKEEEGEKEEKVGGRTTSPLSLQEEKLRMKRWRKKKLLLQLAVYTRKAVVAALILTAILLVSDSSHVKVRRIHSFTRSRAS